MFNIINRNKENLNEKEKLEHVFIEKLENNKYYISPPKYCNMYYNYYIWEYAMIDIIYNLLYGFSFIAVVNDEKYSNLLSDIKGYNTYRLLDNCNLTFLYSTEGVGKDFLIESQNGSDIWSYNDHLLVFYGVSKDIFSENKLDSLILNLYAISVEPYGDGEGLMIKINDDSGFNSLFNNIAECLNVFGIELKIRD